MDGPNFNQFLDVFQSKVIEYSLDSIQAVGTSKWQQQLRKAATTALRQVWREDFRQTGA